MSTVYDQAKPEVHEMAREIMRDHHPLLRMGVDEYPTLAILMASVKRKDDGTPTSDEPPLKDGAYPVLGMVKAVPYIQRVDGRRDAEIRIDAAAWDAMTEPQQRALLDHLITHLKIQVDQDGIVKADDWGRPKLELRPCDWRLSGFREIAQRYGADAPEVAAARVFEERYGDVALKAEAALFGH